MHRHAAAALLLAACAGLPAKAPPSETSPRGGQGSLASAAEGGFENGRLSSPEQSVAGPFVLTYLSPGSELEVATAGPGGGVLGRLAGPLAQPFHVAPGTVLRLPAPGEAVYAGQRPMPITRALEGWLGRKILVAYVGLQAATPGARSGSEEWSLRGLAGDHLTLERSRTYLVVPLRRVAEITWTDLTGADPRPLLVLAPH
jgi:hypothetical protein